MPPRAQSTEMQDHIDKPSLVLPPTRTFKDLTWDALGLQKQVFDELRWIAPRILPEGLTLLVGRPKAGKSWMALDLGVAVATGGSFIGQTCEQGDVLALFLEDNKRRIQRRLTSMLGTHKVDWPKRLVCATEWAKLEEGGIEMIKDWIKSVSKPRLVIVDILERVRKHATNGQQSQYSADYAALLSLHKLASDHQLSILVLHHQRKASADNPMDTISGTGGLGGGADAALILGRDEAGRYLWGTGREIDEFRLMVKLGPDFRWSSLGDKPDVQMSPERNLILAALAKTGRPMGLDQITTAVGGKKANVKTLLYKMRDEGIVDTVATGVYCLPKDQSAFDCL